MSAWLDAYFNVAPRVAAFLSIVGSSFIISEVLRSPKKRALSYHRIMLGMSVCDLTASISYVLGRWPLPKNDPSFPGGLGNTQTCTAQGFFGQFIISTVGYNTSLAIYYYLAVIKGWKEWRIKKVEKYLHIFANSFWFITGIVGISLEIFNAALFNCWIAPSPYSCNESDEDCIRGGIAKYFQWAFFYGPIIVMTVFVTAIMTAVYYHVVNIEKKSQRHAFNASAGQAQGNSRQPAVRQQSEQKRSKQVAVQGMWYLAPFYLTWTWAVLYQLIASIGNIHVTSLGVIGAFFMPFQGFMNFLVFMRPRYIKNKASNSSSNICSKFGKMLSYISCKKRTGDDGDDLMDEAANSRMEPASATKRMTDPVGESDKVDSNGMVTSNALESGEIKEEEVVDGSGKAQDE